MSITRRALMSGAAGVVATARAGDPVAITPPAAAAKRANEANGAAASTNQLPAKTEFGPMPVTYLDAGTMHPFSIGAKAAIETYLSSRSLDASAPAFSLDETDRRITERFAALINAEPGEICIVQSTTAGEHLVVRALDIPAIGGRIVTDTLHFPGSFYLYAELAKRGMDVVWVKPRDGRRIELADLEAAIDERTRLVAVSLVSTTNGFQHDLRRVCEIAHAKRAYVYADIVHAAGCVPLDIKASGVDFAACASYKWLMGDFGLGFLYARAELLPKIKRPQFGYEQLGAFMPHVFPYDPPGNTIVDYAPRPDATGYFATGTTSAAGAVHLEYSLEYLSRVGVAAIQAHRQPLLRRARAELIRLGYQPATPEESTSPLLAFVHPNARGLAPKLQQAKVKITLARNHFRICPSVFNDMQDIERLLEALS